MDLSVTSWDGAQLFDAAYLDLAQALVAEGRVGPIRDLMLVAGRHPDLWASEAGTNLLADLLALLLDGLAEGQVAEVVPALAICPPDLAGQAIDLLLGAFFPEGGEEDLAALDDAALLCLALLVGAAGEHDEAIGLIDQAMAQRDDELFAFAALVVRDHLRQAAPRAETFKVKLIIWDLDDTLWRGTLADGDEPVLDERRAAFVRAFNRHGIVSAICSKNDHDDARAKLEAFDLWDAFVFPRIAFLPKGEVIRQLIDDMQLRPANVLFIDDNPRNLEEVAAAAPGISTVDATSPECDRLLAEILADNAHVAKSRVDEYRILETRVAERRQSELTDEAFLRRSAIEATYTHRMDNLDFAGRIEELINRSNQLNYTTSRLSPGAAEALILNVSEYDVFAAFVWDRYGYYGLVGVAIYDKREAALIHFALSCRIMHMGVEDFLIQALRQRYARVGLERLVKPLPPQSSDAITWRPFEEPEVRARILDEEAPRDWSGIRLRLMADCQSGAFHHYSRCRDAYDFDNIPRVFNLAMMMTDTWRDQVFPEFLVYTPATDYMDWRWEGVMPRIDPAAYADAAAQFCAVVTEGDRKLLLFLPPENAADRFYDVIPTATAREMRERNRSFNALWRELAGRYPEHIRFIDLTGIVGEADMVIHAYHYVPSILQRMAGMIDDWYEDAADAS